MTQLNLTNQTDWHRKPHETRARSRSSTFLRLGLIALVISFSLGNRNCNEYAGRSGILCASPLPVRVEPGTCTEFRNPCGFGWSPPNQPDGFGLDPTAEQRRLLADASISIRTTRAGDEVTRSICAGADSPLIIDESIPFFYTRRDEVGLGNLLLTVAPPVPALTIETTASPSTLSVGDSSQLVAHVSGGVPPYFYSWIPTSTLNDNDIAAPIATPGFTTTYTVGVGDSSSLHATGQVTVNVRGQLTVTARPESILAGDPSQLEALAMGGTPPYTFTWAPTMGLDDPSRVAPIARPTTTTTYHVTATDAVGARLTGSATVTVTDEPLSARALANPSSINSGETSQLDVAVTGGVPPYSYSWSESNPTNSLSNRLIRNPVASPAVSTFYGVTVTDMTGATVSDNVAVTVAPAPTPPPTASFVFNVLCCPTLHLDASASTGNIVSYSWDLQWTPASPDLVTSSPTASFAIQEFNRGTIMLTVTDAAGRTATMTQNF